MHFQDCAVNWHFYPYSYKHLAAALSGVTWFASLQRYFNRWRTGANTLFSPL